MIATAEPMFAVLSLQDDFEPLQLSRDYTDNNPMFGWSDIPCQGEHGMVEDELIKLPMLVSPPSSPPPFTLCSSSNSWDSPPPSPKSSIQHDLDQVVRKCPHNRRVSFAPTLKVRTHEVVLGDHPCCVGGMALSCGWDLVGEESTLPLVDNSRGTRTMKELHMTYSERRERLCELTGRSGSELLKEEYELLCRGESHTLRHAPTFRQLATV